MYLLWDVQMSEPVFVIAVYFANRSVCGSTLLVCVFVCVFSLCQTLSCPGQLAAHC